MDAADSVAALQAAGFQTAAQVASTLATALLSYTDSAGVNALLAVRDGRLDDGGLPDLSAGRQRHRHGPAAVYVQQTALDAALGLRDLRLDTAEASIQHPSLAGRRAFR